MWLLPGLPQGRFCPVLASESTLLTPSTQTLASPALPRRQLVLETAREKVRTQDRSQLLGKTLKGKTPVGVSRGRWSLPVAGSAGPGKRQCLSWCRGWRGFEGMKPGSRPRAGGAHRLGEEGEREVSARQRMWPWPAGSSAGRLKLTFKCLGFDLRNFLSKYLMPAFFNAWLRQNKPCLLSCSSQPISGEQGN